MGIGIVEVGARDRMRALEWMVIETAANTPLPDRLKEIAEDLTSVLEEYKPELAVIEKIYFAKNETTAIDVAQARGVALLSLAQAGVEILEPTPMQLKSGITGDGGADKIQMQQMVMQMLQLKEVPKPDDAADALALAIYGALVAPAISLKINNF